jgi:hypothetical protein
LRRRIQSRNHRIGERKGNDRVNFWSSIYLKDQGALREQRLAMGDGRLPHDGGQGHVRVGSRWNVDPQARLDMQSAVRFAVGDFLQVVEGVQEDVVLLGAAVGNISADMSKFQSFQGAIDFQEEWQLVMKIRARDQIESSTNPSSGKFSEGAKFWVGKRKMVQQHERQDEWLP